jgi:hypothetical protein
MLLKDRSSLDSCQTQELQQFRHWARLAQEKIDPGGIARPGLEIKSDASVQDLSAYILSWNPLVIYAICIGAATVAGPPILR